MSGQPSDEIKDFLKRTNRTVGIIGGGTVGRAQARLWMESHYVMLHDRIAKRSTHTLVATLHCDVILICLPEDEVGPFLTSCVLSFRKTQFVIKSTVPIGTTKRLSEQLNLFNMVHSPEFLTERVAVADTMTPSRNIIGFPRKLERPSIYNDMLLTRFPGVPLLLMGSDESEAVKLMTNAFFSVKVGLFNEFRSLADKLGLEWETILAGIMSDGRIAHSHNQVPGPDGKRGFGGKCLPKDLAMLIDCMIDNGLNQDIRHDKLITAAAQNRNYYDRKVT